MHYEVALNGLFYWRIGRRDEAKVLLVGWSRGYFRPKICVCPLTGRHFNEIESKNTHTHP